MTAACQNAPSTPTATSTAVPPPPTPPPSSSTSTSGSTAIPTSTSTATPTKISFDDLTAGSAPKGFAFGRTGRGAAGKWIVRAESAAPSAPNALVQTDTDDTADRYPVAVADTPSAKDVRVSVKCRPISGKVDQACGLVVRYQDENNYMLARANALEDNVRLYAVKDGQRRQIANWSGKVQSGAWHTLAFEATGDKYEVTFDDKKVIEQRDAAFGAAGRAGVWTKADTVTAFDDLSIEAR